MSLANMQGKMNRMEMKMIMAGSSEEGAGCKCCWTGTTTCSACTYTNGICSSSSCAAGATAESC